MKEKDLEGELSRPGHELIEAAAAWSGDIVVLGAGGKTGVGIAVMARRALVAAGREDLAVLAVSRWSDASRRDALREAGVQTLQADLSDPASVDALPDAGTVVHLAGAKFGTDSAPERAWMTNTVLPAYVARRYRDARIVALSTGNVYGMSAPVTGGSMETDPPRPEGDYAITCLGRERVFTHAAREQGTPVALIRLNYACEPRYGVLADLAGTLRRGAVVDLRAGAVNVVWQRYANEVVLRSADHTAPGTVFTLNLAGPETANVGTLASGLAERLGVEPRFVGAPPESALLSNAMRCHSLFGYPDLTLGQLLDRQAEWVLGGGTVWDKPTRFERRDGRF